MEVITVIHKYPRKRTEASVWIVEGAEKRTSMESNDYITERSIKRLFCAHPTTSPEQAEIIAAAWKITISTEEGRALVNKAQEEGY